MAKRFTYYWLTALVLTALSMRLGYAVLATDPKRNLPPRDQAREYVMVGARLLTYGTLTSPLILKDSDHGPSAVMPPAYAALVAALYGLLGIESSAAGFVLYTINAVATSLCVLCAFHLGRRLCGGTAGWLAAILVTINPTLIGFTSYVWDTNLFCLGVTLAALLAVGLSERPAGTGRWLGFGPYLGVLALLNPALTSAYPFLVLWPITKAHGWHVRPMLRGIGLAMLGWLLAIAPWTIRNYVHFDRLFYIRNGFPIELWLGACPTAESQGDKVYRQEFPLLNADVQEHIASVGEQAYISECREQAIAAIKKDPVRFVRLIGVRIIDYYLGTVYSHVGPGKSGWPRSALRAVIAAFLGAEFVALAVLFLLRPRCGPDVWWLLAIIGSFSIVYCLTHVVVRFRAPTEPLLAVALAVLACHVLGSASAPAKNATDG